MYRSSAPPLAGRLTALSILTVMLTSIASPFIGIVSADYRPRTDHSKNVTTAEVATALQDASGVLSTSQDTAATSDDDTALQANTNGDSVDIRKHASDG